jgi:hypothetical protein
LDRDTTDGGEHLNSVNAPVGNGLLACIGGKPTVPRLCLFGLRAYEGAHKGNFQERVSLDQDFKAPTILLSSPRGALDQGIGAELGRLIEHGSLISLHIGIPRQAGSYVHTDLIPKLQLDFT